MTHDEMICEECHRIEDDPIMLDVQMCKACGSFLTALDVDRDERTVVQEREKKE